MVKSYFLSSAVWH